MSNHLADSISHLRSRTISIFIGPRPGRKSFNALKDLELTHCCTLLSEREGGRAIEAICGKLECDWVWLPMEGGRVEVLRETDLTGHVGTLADAIAQTSEPRIYLHCSAGIHRTGFFAYLLLRLRGADRDAALRELAVLRTVTADQVGEERIDLADEVAAELAASSDR